MILKLAISGVIFTFASFCSAQVAGNANYHVNLETRTENTQAVFPSINISYLTTRGMMNVVPDNFVAIFGLEQIGKTMEETTKLLKDRLTSAEAELLKIKDVSLYTDLISFVPKYELVKEKKTFNKTTYIEVPIGFELRKNLHISFKDVKQLDVFIEVLAKYEIYNFVKLECFSSKMEEARKQLETQVATKFQEKIKFQQTILGNSFNEKIKRISDESKVYLPFEMYQRYNSPSHVEEIQDKSSYFKREQSDAFQFYNPYTEKDFDLIVNPINGQLCIQLVYELRMELNQSPELESKEKNYILGPNGELKIVKIPIN